MIPYGFTAGFIALQTEEIDSIGLLKSRNARSRKGKGKQKAGKNIKRARYSPVPEAMSGKKYQDYFQPAREGTLLGMVCYDLDPQPIALMNFQTKPKDMSSRASKTQTFRIPDLPQAQESVMQPQTTRLPIQDGLQSTTAIPLQSISKRKSINEAASAPAKRMKTSVGPGISLDD